MAKENLFFWTIRKIAKNMNEIATGEYFDDAEYTHDELKSMFAQGVTVAFTIVAVVALWWLVES